MTFCVLWLSNSTKYNLQLCFCRKFTVIYDLADFCVVNHILLNIAQQTQYNRPSIGQAQNAIWIINGTSMAANAGQEKKCPTGRRPANGHFASTVIRWAITDPSLNQYLILTLCHYITSNGCRVVYITGPLLDHNSTVIQPLKVR